MKSVKKSTPPITHILRTRIKRDIVCEFLPPAKPSRKVIILCSGAPSYPGKRDLLKFLSTKGYWVFLPRYRGSWESGGLFLKISPHRDVLDVINQLPRGFKDLWSGKTYKIARPEIYLIGSSFGGAAVILSSRDRRVRRAVAFSPVTDWRAETKAEPIEKLFQFTRAAFGNGYRGTQRDWNKLKTGTFYNPAHEAALHRRRKAPHLSREGRHDRLRADIGGIRARDRRAARVTPARRPSFRLQHDGAEILERNKTVFKMICGILKKKITS